MRADTKIGGALGRMAIAKGIGCMLCGRQDVSADDVADAIAEGDAALCGRCRADIRPTAMDMVLDASGWTAPEFAEASGLPLRTIVRATKGQRLSKRVALALARLTGLPWQTWRDET